MIWGLILRWRQNAIFCISNLIVRHLLSHTVSRTQFIHRYFQIWGWRGKHLIYLYLMVHQHIWNLWFGLDILFAVWYQDVLGHRRGFLCSRGQMVRNWFYSCVLLWLTLGGILAVQQRELGLMSLTLCCRESKRGLKMVWHSRTSILSLGHGLHVDHHFNICHVTFKVAQLA